MGWGVASQCGISIHNTRKSEHTQLGKAYYIHTYVRLTLAYYNNSNQKCWGRKIVKLAKKKVTINITVKLEKFVLFVHLCIYTRGCVLFSAHFTPPELEIRKYNTEMFKIDEL